MAHSRANSIAAGAAGYIVVCVLPPPLISAWQKRSKQTERDYLAFKLDDPSVPAPIYATLTEVEGEDRYQLIWSI